MEEGEFTLKSPFQAEPAQHDGDVLPDFILKRVRENVEAGKTTWITDAATGESQDLSHFEELSRRVACNMYKKGLRKGDTVIFMTSHFVRLASFFVGVWRANGIVRSSYPEDDADTLAMRVEESRAGWILCDEGLTELCLEVADRMYWEVEVIVVGDHESCTPFDYLFDEMDAETELPATEICEDDPALILCTSGTTGRSKGAVHTHRTVIHAISATMFMPFPEDKCSLLVTKCTHITGSLFPLTLVCSGKQGVVMSSVTKAGIYQAVQDYKPGLIWGFPTFLLALVVDPEAAKYDFSSLEIAATGGAQVTPAMEKVMANLSNVKALINFYGLTEVIPITAELDYDDAEGKVKLQGVPPFSVGKVCPGVKVQIRDPDSGQVLGPHQKGEICCRSPAMFSHYINNQQATNDAFIEGWFRTGDLGYYDEDDFIFLVDRMKEIFKYWNNHISPTEIEDVINQHTAVKEVCVVGVEDPEGGGFIPRAFVTLSDPECTTDEIVSFSNDQLPNYKHLRGGLYVVNDLPKGKTGKIQRSLVAQMPIPELGVIAEEDPASVEAEAGDIGEVDGQGEEEEERATVDGGDASEGGEEDTGGSEEQTGGGEERTEDGKEETEAGDDEAETGDVAAETGEEATEDCDEAADTGEGVTEGDEGDDEAQEDTLKKENEEEEAASDVQGAVPDDAEEATTGGEEDIPAEDEASCQTVVPEDAPPEE